jgi:hypothetical protein
MCLLEKNLKRLLLIFVASAQRDLTKGIPFREPEQVNKANRLSHPLIINIQPAAPPQDMRIRWQRGLN